MRKGKDFSAPEASGTNLFGRRLQFAMAVDSITQAQLSNMVGIAHTTISGYVTGKSIPNIDVATKIAKAMNVSLDWLCGLED